MHLSHYSRVPVSNRERDGPYFSHTSAVSRWKRPPMAFLNSQNFDSPAKDGPGICRKRSHDRAPERTVYTTTTARSAHVQDHTHSNAGATRGTSMLGRTGLDSGSSLSVRKHRGQVSS